MSPDIAETHAARIFAWLVGQEELLPIFMGASGASLDDLKTQSGDPTFLASVMDFILMDDSWVIDAATATGIKPEDMMLIRGTMAGGEQVHWT